jgi:hypothetical protein
MPLFLPLWSGSSAGYLLLPALFNLVLEYLARTITKGKQRKGPHIKKEAKQSDDTILNIENPKKSTTKLSVIISNFLEVAGHKTNAQTSCVFLYS